MAYVYRGKVRDVSEPATYPEPAPPAYDGKHGTPSGYNSHFRAGDRGDQICKPCREARAAKRRAKAAAKGLTPGRKAIYGTGCGSPSGYTAHLRRDEAPCDACREAYNARKREYIAERRAA